MKSVLIDHNRGIALQCPYKIFIEVVQPDLILRGGVGVQCLRPQPIEQTSTGGFSEQFLAPNNN